MRKKGTLLLGAVLAVGLAVLPGCSEKLEGTGSQEGSTAEQLALHEEDPWTAEWNPQQGTATLGDGYRDGVYSGEGQGMDGKVYVTIRIESGQLSVLSVDQDGETQSVGGYEAIKDGTYAKQIEAAQGTGIDGVSGATVTSASIKTALQAALDQARG